jgi:hypothetical protein
MPVWKFAWGAFVASENDACVIADFLHGAAKDERDRDDLLTLVVGSFTPKN